MARHLAPALILLFIPLSFPIFGQSGTVNVVGNILIEDGIFRSREGFQDITLVNHEAQGYIQLDVGGIGHSGDDIILGDLSSPSNKVGIGTSNPGSAISNAMLEVGGGHIVVANNFGFFANSSSGAGPGAGIDTRTDDGMEFYADGGSKMTLRPTGRLGIGTSTPSKLLEVAGGVKVDGNTFNIDETNNRVGIGTSSPAEELEISGNSSPTTRLTNTGSGTVQLEFKRNGSDWRIHNTTGLLFFGQSSDDLSTVNDVLRLGGGTVTPASDNTIQLGRSDLRWTTVYAVNGTINTSDARLKKDITPVESGIDLVKQMNPVKYTWKDERIDQGKLHTGFLAQELQTVVPHVVMDKEWRETTEGGTTQWTEAEHLGVNYSELIPILTKAIQEQQELIEMLQTEVAELKELIND